MENHNENIESVKKPIIEKNVHWWVFTLQFIIFSIILVAFLLAGFDFAPIPAWGLLLLSFLIIRFNRAVKLLCSKNKYELEKVDDYARDGMLIASACLLVKILFYFCPGFITG